MLKKLTKAGLLLFIAAVFAVFFTFGAAAEGIDDGQGDEMDEQSVVVSDVEPVVTEPVPVETEPVTEYIEPATEYVPPETEYVPAETEYVAPVEETEGYDDSSSSYQDEYIALIGDAQEPTDNIAPKMDKSVSNKTYSTDYTAGIVSWICVGVGVVVVIVVLVSTKVSGARASQRLV